MILTIGCQKSSLLLLSFTFLAAVHNIGSYIGLIRSYGANAAVFLWYEQKQSIFPLVLKERKRSFVTAISKESGGKRGFGSVSTSTSSSSSSKTKLKKTNKNNSGNRGFSNEERNATQQSLPNDTKSDDADRTTSIILDKWGLPPPSVEDIFPLMSEGTELIPVDHRRNYTAIEIQQYIQDFSPNKLNWKYLSLSDSSSISNKSKICEKEPMQLRLVHVSPPVVVVDNFLTEQECFDVRRVVEEGGDEICNNNDVVRVQSKTISQYATSKRTSTSWFCQYKSVPTVLSKIQHILGVSDLSKCEEPQIVQYQSGQEFSWHYDELPTVQLSNGGQRVATILIYLNTVPIENGGSTTFRDLTNGGVTSTDTPLSVQPVRGSAIIFYPSNTNGQPDDRTLHRSTPIIGENISKWILQIWVHERSYSATVPQNNRIEHALVDIDTISRRIGYIEE